MGKKKPILLSAALAAGLNPALAQVDVTSKIVNPNFNVSGGEGWTYKGGTSSWTPNLRGGDESNYCAEVYHQKFTLSQEIKNLANGRYRLLVQGFHRVDDSSTDAAPVFFANDKKVNIPVKTGTENSMSDASKSFSDGKYDIYIPVDVTNGTLTIGVECTSEHQWVIFDNFRLEFLGNATQFIANPSFENGLNDWTNNGFWTQKSANDDSKMSEGATICEKWVASGNKLPDSEISQELTLPNGKYDLAVAGGLHDQKNNTSAKGLFLFAGSAQTEMTADGIYFVKDIQVTDGKLKIGARLKNAQGNWAHFDSFQLSATESTLNTLISDLTQQLAINVNKAGKYTDDKDLQDLALEASKIQVKINALADDFTKYSEVKAEIDAIGVKIVAAAANYEAYAYAKAQHENPLTVKLAELTITYNGANEEAQKANKALYDGLVESVAAFLKGAETSYEAKKAATEYSKEVVDTKVQLILGAIEAAKTAITTGSTNASSYANVVYAAGVAEDAYNTAAVELYSLLAGAEQDGSTYTDTYAKALSEINDVLREINKVKAENKAKYDEEKCDPTTQAAFEARLTAKVGNAKIGEEAIVGELQPVVDNYTAYAKTLRDNYTAANNAVAALTSSLKTNVADKIGNRAELTNYYKSASDAITAQITTLQAKVDEANKNHVIANAQGQYPIVGKADESNKDSYCVGYNDAANQINRDIDALKTLVENAVAEYDANVTCTKNIQALQTALDSAKRTVANAKSNDGKYSQAGKFTVAETAIQEAIYTLTEQRTAAYNKAKEAEYQGGIAQEFNTKWNDQIVSGEGEAQTTFDVSDETTKYADNAKEVLAAYNTIATAIAGYNKALYGEDTYYTEDEATEYNNTHKGEEGHVDVKAGDKKGHTDGLVDVVKNGDVTTDCAALVKVDGKTGTDAISENTYAKAIATYKAAIEKLQGEVDAAIAKTDDAHTKAVKALKTLDKYPTNIDTDKSNYTDNETAWNAQQLIAAKERLLAEADRRIKAIDTKIATNEKYENAESTTTTESVEVSTLEFEAKTYGKKAENDWTEKNEKGEDVTIKSLNDQLTAINAKKFKLKEQLNNAKDKYAPEAIPVLSEINTQIETADKDYTDLMTLAGKIKTTYYNEKVANKELKATQAQIVELINGNNSEDPKTLVKGIIALISPATTNFTSEVDAVKGTANNLLTSIGKHFTDEDLVASRPDTKDKDDKVTAKGLDTNLSELNTAVDNLRTLAQNESANATQKAKWDSDVTAADYNNKKSKVLSDIQAKATGEGLAFFEAEYNKIATQSSGTYDKIISDADNAANAKTKSTLAGTLDEMKYTDTNNNMVAKYDDLKQRLDAVMNDLNGLPALAEANEKAHNDQVDAYTKAKADRGSIFTVITNSETSSCHEVAIAAIADIDAKLKAYNTAIADAFKTGACDTKKETLATDMTAITTAIKTLSDGWNDTYKAAVAADNAKRYENFCTAYNKLTSTYSAQVNTFTNMSKLTYAAELTVAYNKATDGTLGIYNVATEIRALKSAADASYNATEAPALWDATQEEAKTAEEMTAEIVNKVKEYCDAVNTKAESTWISMKQTATSAISSANNDLKNTLRYTVAEATAAVKDVQAIVDEAEAKHSATDFAYLLDTDIIPAFKNISTTLTNIKNTEAINTMKANLDAMDKLTTAEKAEVADFHYTDGTTGHYSEQYKTDVLDKVKATKDYWATVAEKYAFSRYSTALGKGYNSVVWSTETEYDGHTSVYADAAKADKAYHANDVSYNNVMALHAQVTTAVDNAAEFVHSLFVQHNTTLLDKISAEEGKLKTYAANAKAYHEANTSAANEETLTGNLNTIVEVNINGTTGIIPTALSTEKQYLLGEIPTLRHDYELATAAAIEEASIDKYKAVIDGYSDKIEAIYTDYNVGKSDELGLPIYVTDAEGNYLDAEGNISEEPAVRVKATAEETRLAYIALEKKMAKTKDELTAYYAPEAAETAATKVQSALDKVAATYQAIVTFETTCHQPVIDKYADQLSELEKAIVNHQNIFNDQKAADAEIFYQENILKCIDELNTTANTLQTNVKNEEKPYDQFDADKATIAQRHTSLEEKLAAVYAKTQTYQHQNSGYWTVGNETITDLVTGKEIENPDFKVFYNYAEYINFLLSQEIAATKAKLAAEVAPNAIDVNSYNEVADGIEKKDGQYSSLAYKSIENMDGYFAYVEDNGYVNDVNTAINSVDYELNHYAHLTATVTEVNAKKNQISNKSTNISNYASNLYSCGYAYKDIDGKAYTAETEGAVETSVGSGEYTLTEDLVLRSPEIISRLKALLEDANALLQKAQENRAIRGDINNDSEVTVSDYTNLAQHIINDNIADYSEREEWAADANADGEINVSDLQKIVLIGTGNFSGNSKAAAFLAKESAANDQLDVQVNDNVLSLGITNAVAYSGFQMDITLPSGASIAEEMLTNRADGQELAVNNIGGNTYRVLVMGADGAAFNGNSGAIANLKLENLHGTVAVSNVVFTDTKANAYKFTLGNEATAINGVEAQQSMTEKIYSVGGQMRGALGKGLNIIKSNGVVKKIMNK